MLRRACTWVYKQANFRQICHCRRRSCIACSSSSPVFTSPPPAALVMASLRRSCFSWRFSCPVDCYCSCTALLVSTKRTAAICFSWRPMPSRPLLFLHHLTIQVHTQERAIQVHTQNVLSKCTLRMCYPSSHSERAIQKKIKFCFIHLVFKSWKNRVHYAVCVAFVNDIKS